MRAKGIATTVSLIATSMFCGLAQADENATTLAWQEPGYVMEVVVTAPRMTPKLRTTDENTTGLAWQEPGYVEDVVIVTASRSEVMAAAGLPEFPLPRLRHEFFGLPSR